MLEYRKYLSRLCPLIFPSDLLTVCFGTMFFGAFEEACLGLWHTVKSNLSQHIRQRLFVCDGSLKRPNM
jgi:hypothetical protein